MSAAVHLDPQRLARALTLRVAPARVKETVAAGHSAGALVYRVTGGEDPHLVNAARRRCDCPDFVVRNVAKCKHLTAALLHEREPETWAAAGALVAEALMQACARGDKRVLDVVVQALQSMETPTR